MPTKNGEPLIGETQAEEVLTEAQRQFNEAELLLIARAGMLRNVTARVSQKLQQEMYPTIVEAAVTLAEKYDQLADASKVAMQYAQK